MKTISSFQTHDILGLQNICDDIHFMVSTKVGIYWRITWGIVTPGVLIIIFIYFLATLTRITYGSFEYPDHVLGKTKNRNFNLSWHDTRLIDDVMFKTILIKDIHNSWLYCFTNPLELGTRVSRSIVTMRKRNTCPKFKRISETI